MTAHLMTRIARLEAGSSDLGAGAIVLAFRTDDEKEATIAGLVRTGLARSNDLFICLGRFSDAPEHLVPYRLTSHGEREYDDGSH